MSIKQAHELCMNLLVIWVYVRKYNGRKSVWIFCVIDLKSVPILSMSSFENLKNWTQEDFWEWNELAQDGVQWRALMMMVMILQIPLQQHVSWSARCQLLKKDTMLRSGWLVCFSVRRADTGLPWIRYILWFTRWENWDKEFVTILCFWFINEPVLNLVDCLYGNVADYLSLIRYMKAFHLGTSQINVMYCCKKKERKLKLPL
jgi:hypothetical protein